MNIIGIILIVLLVLFALVLIINKPFRQQLVIKLKGRTDEIMSNDAMTPEGAADYYNNAIREMEEKYSAANRLFTEVTGKLENSKKDLYSNQKELMKKNKEINSAIDSNNENEAMTLAMAQETINAKIETLKETIEELEQSKNHQKEVRDQLAVELEALKQEKEATIFRLQADQQIIQLHESVDAIAPSNESDRMLERVREGANKTRERATGSRIAYETSATTQERRAEQNARERAARERVEEMKRQRGK